MSTPTPTPRNDQRGALQRSMVLALSMLAVPGPGFALENKGGNYLLTAAEARACEDGNGCAVIPNMALLDALHQAGESGFAQGIEAGTAAGYRAGLTAGQRSCSKGLL